MCQCLLKSHGIAMSLCHTLVSDRAFPVIGLNSSSCGGTCSSTKLMLPALYHTMMSMKNAQRRMAPVVPVRSNMCYLRVINTINNPIQNQETLFLSWITYEAHISERVDLHFQAIHLEIINCIFVTDSTMPTYNSNYISVRYQGR